MECYCTSAEFVCISFIVTTGFSISTTTLVYLSFSKSITIPLPLLGITSQNSFFFFHNTCRYYYPWNIRIGIRQNGGFKYRSRCFTDFIFFLVSSIWDLHANNLCNPRILIITLSLLINISTIYVSLHFYNLSIQ